MKLTTKSLISRTTLLGLLATVAVSACTPVLADPGSQQNNKNTWRNLGIAGAVVAGYGLLKHNQTATVLGAAGAAYSANRYEQDRQHQSQDSTNRRRYYRTFGWNPSTQYNNNNGYNNNQYGNNGNNGGYNNGGYNNNGGYSNNGDYNGQNGDYNGQNAYVRRGNGRHLGWSKKNHDKRDGDRD